MPIFNSFVNFLIEVLYELQIAPNPFYAGVILFINGLWVPILIMAINASMILWRDWRQGIYHAKRKYVLLAIDVPRNNEQSPKAVESIFTQLHGALPGRNTLYQEWWRGKTTDFFSMELISIEGYVQFLVYTQVDYRDMVESAFYAQYPDAEITQVEDYVYGQNGELKNLVFPNKKYEIYACEFDFIKPDAYPIRLYMDFEHSLSQEFKDPMASLLENMNKIGPSEQLWLQLVITPEFDYKWHPKANAIAMKIAGKKLESSSNIADKIISGIVTSLDAFGSAVFPFYNQTEDNAQLEREMPSLMLHLTPTEQKQLEGVQMKADKHGFWTKFRYLYIADKAIATKARGLSPVMGSMRQFGSLNMNALRPHKYTKTWSLYYFMVPQRLAMRQNKILRAYQDRSRAVGSNGIILNTEELATLYHFPTEVVKAPLVSRTQSKRASAPISLPIEGAPRTLRESVDDQKPPEPKKAQSTDPTDKTPNNLPFI
ncbi:hypothetical protein KKF64_02215 [Patescibacteria group bacterium]|nr:hypothetical protein [Patescibacteria group bacterium]